MNLLQQEKMQEKRHLNN